VEPTREEPLQVRLDKHVDVERSAGSSVQGLLMQQRHDNRRYKRKGSMPRVGVIETFTDHSRSDVTLERDQHRLEHVRHVGRPELPAAQAPEEARAEESAHPDAPRENETVQGLAERLI
jgi:hypothetical protein